MEQAVTQTTHRRRPRAVSFVASLLLMEAVLVVLAGIVLGAVQVAGMPMLGWTPDDAFGPLLSALPVLGLTIVIVVVGGGLALAGLGLLQVREWGWVLAMSLQGLGLADALYAHFHGDRPYVTLTLCSVVVLALNQREVRQAFGTHDRHA